MRKKIYQAIAERLRGKVPDVKYISLWNRNTEQLSKQMAFRMPAVFVEFEPVTWSQYTQGVRSADVRVRLHIVTETLATPEYGGRYQDKALAHLELIENISAAIQGLAGDGFNGFMLVESVTDHNHTQVEDNEECYITRFTDNSARRPQTVAVGVQLGKFGEK